MVTQLTFVPIALVCATAALLILNSGYKDEIWLQPRIDFWFYFLGMMGALNIVEAFASSAGASFSENMGVMAWAWPVGIVLVVVRMLTRRQEAHR